MVFNKEELIKLKQLIENELEEVDKKSEELNNRKEYIRQKPKLGEEYYYLTDEGRVNKAVWNDLYRDNLRFQIGNCFKTEQEALSYRENLVTKQELKDLALELNNGVDIDFTIPNNKYSIVYFEPSHLELFNVGGQRNIGDIYCLNRHFLNIAKERIGVGKILKLIKSGI